MPLCPPHGPVHEPTEFWYDTEEAALLYEVTLSQNRREAFADHTLAREKGRIPSRFHSDHDHYQPHGITFRDDSIPATLRTANEANTELIIRLWCQAESNEQPSNSGFTRLLPLLPVPKALAIFLEAKRTVMHKGESVTQALILLQAHLTGRQKDNVSS